MGAEDIVTISLPEHDEAEFTPHGERGWHSWDAWSPEYEFCAFAGTLQRMIKPATIIETGVGIGRITQFLNLKGLVIYLGYETDPNWRKADWIEYQPHSTPTTEEMSSADLVILDSEVETRLDEISLWRVWGKPGSVCLVHDVGNGHPTDEMSTWNRIRDRVIRTGFPGMWLMNPRGGWLGIHP